MHGSATRTQQARILLRFRNTQRYTIKSNVMSQHKRRFKQRKKKEREGTHPQANDRGKRVVNETDISVAAKKINMKTCKHGLMYSYKSAI